MNKQQLHDNHCIECGEFVPCLCNNAANHLCPACLQMVREREMVAA